MSTTQLVFSSTVLIPILQLVYTIDTDPNWVPKELPVKQGLPSDTYYEMEELERYVISK